MKFEGVKKKINNACYYQVYPVDKKSEIGQCYVIGSHWTLYLFILIRRNQYLKQQSLSTLNDMCLCHEIVHILEKERREMTFIDRFMARHSHGV